MIPDVEIIPHVWQYHRLMTLQLSSFIHWPPTCRVFYRPCVTQEDTPTIAVLKWFSNRLPSSVTLEPHIMDRRRLMRRAIGRNECALTSKSPIVWFADCDYAVLPGDLESIMNAWPKGHKLAHPGHVRATIPEHGMEMIQSVIEPRVMPMMLSDFPLAQKHRTAIGGLQFFDGEHCHKMGYCGPKGRGRLFRPADRWQPTKCDKWARSVAGEDVTMRITVLGRVRHTTRSEGHKEDARL
jgi:hypothetical protein